ncbi:MAG: site-2 protease family protein [Gorillibacterium sp.]|nr:site-2 protease family protein [Gorillibacterium sp.]
MGINNLLQHPEYIPFIFLVLMIAFTLHEFSHAFTADRFGDITPRAMGRVTLNPRVHLDVLGTILIFLVGFGWAKPVLINPSRFRKPRLMSIVVSLAGPLSNLLLVALGMLSVYLLDAFGQFAHMSPGVITAVALFLKFHIQINLMLFLFNLLPLPPLDGYRILLDLLPLPARLKLQQISQWFVFIFMLIIFFEPLYNVTLGPIFSLTVPIFGGMDNALAATFGFYFDWGKLWLTL